MDKIFYENYAEYMHALYYPKGISDEGIELSDAEAACRTVTFVVTDECQLRCTYCYEINKSVHKMTKETAHEAVDLLFDMYYADDNPFINKKTISLIIEFIGGEPLLNMDVVMDTSKYFLDRCIREHHIWALTSKFCISTNGQAYFDPKFQEYLKLFPRKVSLGISIDGPKHIHDRCRVYPDGKGSFDIAYKAFEHYAQNYGQLAGTKVTIARGNLDNLQEIVKFFLDRGVVWLNANCVFEEDWQLEDAQKFYKELKSLADYYLTLSSDIYIAFFIENFFHPMDPNFVQCWCGGSGKMLSFDWDGTAYPCTRFNPTSLGNDIEPLVIGSTKGLFKTEECSKTFQDLCNLNRRNKSTDECFYCPVGEGCAECEAWNYQEAGGKLGHRSTRICWMHKARSLANVYYWNKLYKQNNEDKHFKMWLPKEDAIQIVGEDEYEMLLKLSEG